MNKNKPVLFVDFNGVLSYKKFWFSLENSDHILSSWLPHIEECIFSDKDLCRDWMRGNISSEEIHQMIVSELGLSYNDLWKQFKIDCAQLDVSKVILEKVKELQIDFNCVLRTDNMDAFNRFTIPAHPEITEAFDLIDNSYTLGTLKKDDGGQYFCRVASSLGVHLSQCVLIDDSLSVCKLFELLGGKSYCVTGEQEVLKVLMSL